MYVLIVDSHELFAHTLVTVLVNVGMQALSTAEPSEALTAIRQQPPAVILLDLESAEQHPALLEAIHHASSHPIPVIGMALRLLTEREVAQRGLRGYLSKPFEIDALLAVVQSYVKADNHTPSQ